jgi:hypothetical protein
MTKSKKNLTRSNTLEQLYPASLVKKTFGTLYPTAAQRHAHFFALWRQWEENKLVFRNNGSVYQRTTEVRKVCKNIGLKEFWDFQVIAGEVRFCEVEMLAFFLLAAPHFAKV